MAKKEEKRKSLQMSKEKGDITARTPSRKREAETSHSCSCDCMQVTRDKMGSLMLCNLVSQSRLV